MERQWYDTAILAVYIFFGFYKGFRIAARSRLSWSFRIYNYVIAVVFFVSVFFLPFVRWHRHIEGGVLTLGRIALLVALAWCVYELECEIGTIPRLWRRLKQDRRKLIMYIGGGVLLLILIIILLVWIF